MNPLHFGRDPADVRIVINPTIRIGILDHFFLKFWRWRRFALSEHSLVHYVIRTMFIGSQLKQVLPDTPNLAPCPIAGCCHLVNLMAWSKSHCPSVLRAELSVGWVDPRIGLGWVGSRFCSFRWVGLGRIWQKYYIFWWLRNGRLQGTVQVKYKGVWKIGVFPLIYCFISKTVQDTAIVTMEDH